MMFTISVESGAPLAIASGARSVREALEQINRYRGVGTVTVREGGRIVTEGELLKRLGPE